MPSNDVPFVSMGCSTVKNEVFFDISENGLKTVKFKHPSRIVTEGIVKKLYLKFEGPSNYDAEI